MSGTRLGAVILASFALALGWRAVELAQTPAFTLGRVEYRRPTIEVHGFEFAHKMASGTLRVNAARAIPGHATVGYFKLGPSTFLELQKVTATFSAPSAVGWQVTGGVAHLDAQDLVFSESPLLMNAAGAAQSCREVRISLDSGRVRVR